MTFYCGLVTGVTTMTNIKTRNIRASIGKTYQDARLNADGAAIRPVLTA